MNNRLTHVSKISTRFSKYLCSCGVEKIISRYDVERGQTKSCGCLNRELATARNTTHGMSQTNLYQVWFAMIRRCEEKSNKQYPDYGGRGIKVCKSWHKFENFYSDMGDRIGKVWLERKNNDRGYCPSNCKWATPIEQASNTRKNVHIKFKGETRTISGWSRKLGISSGAMWVRFSKLSVKDAITKKIKSKPASPEIFLKKKKCSRCGILKCREFFYASPRKSGGIDSNCKLCHSILGRERMPIE